MYSLPGKTCPDLLAQPSLRYDFQIIVGHIVLTILVDHGSADGQNWRPSALGSLNVLYAVTVTFRLMKPT